MMRFRNSWNQRQEWPHKVFFCFRPYKSLRNGQATRLFAFFFFWGKGRKCRTNSNHIKGKRLQNADTYAFKPEEGGQWCHVVSTIVTLWWHSKGVQSTWITLWTNSPQAHWIFNKAEAIWLSKFVIITHLTIKLGLQTASFTQGESKRPFYSWKTLTLSKIMHPIVPIVISSI